MNKSFSRFAAVTLFSLFAATAAQADVNTYRVHGTVQQVDAANGKVTLAQLYAINPFIFIGQDRGKEVHLVGYSPTNSANKSYFGLGNDNSSEMFYSSKKGFPWALNIPAPIAYMQESVDFVKGYPDFAGWVESGGSKNKDWYTKNINKVALY